MINTVIFDLDGVLCRYDMPVRLMALAEVSGRPVNDIHHDLWESGFEEEADAGRYPDSQAYLAAFAERLRYPISRDEWIEARQRSMTPFNAVLKIAARLKSSRTIAILTNNVPLLRETLPKIFPQASKLFGDHIYFSCDYSTAKPDPDLYRLVAERCASDPASCLFIDDKMVNVEGAKQAGMQGICFTDQAALAAQLGQAGVVV